MLEPAIPAELLAAARQCVPESDAHKRLKEYVAAHPVVIGRGDWKTRGIVEYPLPSADRIDVLFQTPWTWLAAEVKAANAGAGDILRGLFQCVKYKALLQAEADIRQLQPAIEAVLVLEGELPSALIPARNILGITVYVRVVPA